jgi:cell division septal protein FtsQ
MAVVRFFCIERIELVGRGVDVVVDEKRIPKNLLFFPSERIRKELLLTNTLLSDIIIQKQFPGTLRVIPVIRIPFVRLTTSNAIAILDREGIVLPKESMGQNTLPEIRIETEIPAFGKRINAEIIQFALQAIIKANGIISVESVTREDETSIRLHSGYTDIIITQSTQLRTALATLQTLLAGFRIKGTLPAVVDLRFDKPVIKN